MLYKIFLRCSFFAALASQNLVAANHGLRVSRRNHRQHHARHAHAIATVSTTTLVPPIPTTSSAESGSTLPTSRFITCTLSSDAVSVTDTPISTTSNENISSFEDLDDSAEVPPTSKIATSPLTPNGIKAGIAGGDAYPFMKDHIGWWYDWTPNPSKPGKPIAVPMLWGAGTADKTDAARLAAFKKISAPPPYVLAYEEPDCPPGSGSAGISVAAGVAGWESLIVPLGKKGTLTGSPSMCKQADETWLNQFKSKISVQWDITAIHINKNSLEGVKKDIEHYWNTYKKPIWVTEFACVNDKNGFVPCTNQAEINAFINVIVPYLESNEHVYAYAYSNGLGLGDVWPLTKGSALSASGKTYLAAISKFH